MGCFKITPIIHQKQKKRKEKKRKERVVGRTMSFTWNKEKAFSTWPLILACSYLQDSIVTNDVLAQ
jgi:hypothetical protein